MHETRFGKYTPAISLGILSTLQVIHLPGSALSFGRTHKLHFLSAKVNTKYFAPSIVVYLEKQTLKSPEIFSLQTNNLTNH